MVGALAFTANMPVVASSNSTVFGRTSRAARGLNNKADAQKLPTPATTSKNGSKKARYPSMVSNFSVSSIMEGISRRGLLNNMITAGFIGTALWILATPAEKMGGAKAAKAATKSDDSNSEYKDPMKATVTSKVFFEVTIGGEPIGRIVIGLFGNDLPKTSENFQKLATNELGFGYNGSIFHRNIRNFMVQGGDFTRMDGTGGKSIFGGNGKFADEGFPFTHSSPGMLSMANAGKNTNGSQFFITFNETPWLDGKHVLFGRVLEGMDVLKKIEASPTGARDRPRAEIKVVDSGVLAS